MPTYRSITVSLISQFDILTIPEYEPPKVPNDPFLNAPTLVNHDHSLVSVYIPTYPCSRFWLSYSVSPPYPPKMLYYFKLFINGSHIVSWGCGKEDGYEGKTMFGLFNPGPDPFKRSSIERRALCFGADLSYSRKSFSDDLKDVLEVKVFRSKGRKRTVPELVGFSSVFAEPESDGNKPQRRSSGSAMNLINAGPLPAKHPRRFYKYALLDPLDQPFATFRYYYRDWEQLENLGVVSPSSSIRSSIQSLAATERPPTPISDNEHQDSHMSEARLVDIKVANASTETIKIPAKNDNESTMITPDAGPANSITKTESTADSEDQDFSSPLRVGIMTPPSLARPPTPPPCTTPSKAPELRHADPLPDTSLLNTVTSKESFTSLIRSRLPDPDTSAFRLHEMVAEPRPPSPSRTRSSSLSTLMGVVSSAKNRRKRNGETNSSSEDFSRPSQEDEKRTEEVGEMNIEEKRTCRQEISEEGREDPENVNEKQRKNSDEQDSINMTSDKRDFANEEKRIDSDEGSKASGETSNPSTGEEGTRRHTWFGKRKISEDGGSGSVGSGGSSHSAEGSRKGQRKLTKFNVWKDV